MSRNTNTRRRLLRELEEMSQDTVSGMHASIIDPANIMHLQGQFQGPPGTPYAGGTYLIDIQLPDNYPFLPPKMRFITKVWHPNVSSQTGAICLDTLSQKWSPVLTIKTALLSLQSLLDAPEPSDPQDAQVANQMLTQPEAYKRTARQWAIMYAGAPADGEESNAAAVNAQMMQYKGYKKEVVDNFVNMGFTVANVVAALESEGVEKYKASPTDAQTEAVVERLLMG